LFAFVFIVFFALVNFGIAQEEMMDKDTPPAKPGGNFPGIKETSPGIFQIGGVTLDKNTKTVTFPATVNMDHGTLEYLIVENGGKTHESVFATKVEPYHLHLAMLLLGAKVPKPADGAAPPGYMNMEYLKTAPKPKGDGVIIQVHWKDGDKDIVANAEDFLYNDETKAPMTRGPWVYSGSMLSNGVFLAQEEKSIACLVIDPASLIINTRPGSDNNQIWSVRADKIPKAETPVEISIRLQYTSEDLEKIEVHAVIDDVHVTPPDNSKSKPLSNPSPSPESKPTSTP